MLFAPPRGGKKHNLPDNDVENYTYSWQTVKNKPIPPDTSAAKQRS